MNKHDIIGTLPLTGIHVPSAPAVETNLSVGQLDATPCKGHAELRAADLYMKRAMMTLLDLKPCGGEGLERVVVGDEAASDNICSLIQELCILEQQHQRCNGIFGRLHLHLSLIHI